MKDIDVLIPTLRRPDHLTRALRSVFAQTGARELIASVVVVDNSPEASAAAVVNALRPASPVPLTYVHEPRPGVATARNAGLAASAAPLVAFLDDDEEAPPHWLAELRPAHLGLGSAVTFGPVRGVAPDARPEFRAYLDRFFSRMSGSETAIIPIASGCGNSMMTRALALAGPEPFDARSDLTGGEDDRLFSVVREAGLTFGWAAKAWVYEYAPPHRAHVRYALKRAFCYGQSPSQTSLRERNWPGLARNMAIGAGQAGIYGLAALVLAAFGRRSAAVELLDRAVRGAGKVCWPLEVRLYGLAAAPTPPAATQAARVTAQAA
jgi:succinoglycan biosynthesis protein ExoM